MDDFLLTSGNKTRLHSLAAFIQNCIKSPRQSNSQVVEINQKGRVIVSLYADDMILHIENPKGLYQKLSEVVSIFREVTVCKINI